MCASLIRIKYILQKKVTHNTIVDRVGQIGTNLEKWDNGLYVTGLIQEVPVHVFGR